MKRRVYVSLIIGALALSACGTFAVLSTDPASAQTAQQPVIYLNQAWSQRDREWWYNFSQGSSAISYDIFLNLEVAGSQELFRSDANSERYGMILNAPNWNNPDGLPIGLTKTPVPKALMPGEHVGDYVGPNCALCHNAQLYYKGKRIRIDGGVNNTVDMQAWIYAMDDALQATLNDPAKFDRLASRLKASDAGAKSALRKRLEGDADNVHQYRTRVVVTPTRWGPSRMDAIALIINRLTNQLPGIPENWSTPVAPTKPPFMWNAPQGLWTQWRGPQQVPIERNLIETMGVYMSINLHAKDPKEGLFESNANVRNIQDAENLIARLAPPSWPEEVFGKIDREKAARGKDLFVPLCSTCHNVWPYVWTEPNKYGKRFVLVGLTPQSLVGTDPNQFETAREYTIPRQLSPYMPGPFKDKDLVPTGDMYYGIVKLVLESAIARAKIPEADMPALLGYRELPTPRPAQRVYKAAPRDGVWATPPFMHNGSVPNLYEMLVPARERTKKFCLGREFDPVKVGLDTTCGSGAFEIDTALRGNSNAGHSFEDAPRGNGVIGNLLTDEQRWALVEYLKSIPETPGRVTPFGGPPVAK